MSGGKKEQELYLEGDKPTIYKKKKIKWTRVLKWGALVLMVILAALFVVGYIWLKTKEAQMRLPGVEESLDKKQKDQPVTTLVMGVDRGSAEGESELGRADIMMLVSVNPKNKKAAIISIPRDTRVEIPGYSGYNKINASYALGGPSLAIETVKQFTGLDVNHYVVIDFEGFKEIVNGIGGVPMHIDVAIHDKYAGDVPAGDVVLNGDQALALVRARHDVRAVPAGDLDRVKNQQRFLQSMLSAVSNQRNPFKLKKIIDLAAGNIRTDMTFGEMFSLGRKLKGVGSEQLQTTTAPGAPDMIDGVWYYIVDMPEFEAVLETFKTSSEVETTEKESDSGLSGRENIKVEVLNGSGKSGLASSVSKELERLGYRGVEYGNAESDYNRTTIYYSSGNSSDAGTVAADLEGCYEPLLEENDQLTSEYGAKVLVVLGEDYKG